MREFQPVMRRSTSPVSFRVYMGLRPTQRDENRRPRHPRASGGPLPYGRNWIPAPPLSRRTSFAGMTGPGWFSRKRSEESRSAYWTSMLPTRSEIALPPLRDRNDTAGQFFQAFRGFPQIRRRSRFLADFGATLNPSKLPLDKSCKIGYISYLRLGWRPRPAGNTMVQCCCLAQAPEDLPQG